MAAFNRINKLRFFQILRPHLGEGAAEQFSDALQDEFAPLISDEQVRSIVHGVAATFDAALAESETRVIKFVVGTSAAVIATMGICTGILVAVLG